MPVESIASLLMYGVITFGLGWPLAARLAASAREKIVATAALSLLGVFLIAWFVYVLAIPLAVLWGLPMAAAIGLIESRRALREAWRDPEVRELTIAQALVTAWCVGWLALVVSYSGGGWTVDWFEHWRRTLFFLERGPTDILFNGFDRLTSRPPLANVVVGALLRLTTVDFAHYQLATTFFGSLVFLPAACLAHRLGGRPATRLLCVLFLLNPMLVQNATFAWTKLPAAFFTLAALNEFFRARDSDLPPVASPFCAAFLASAVLTHYSAGPYAVVLVAAWLAHGWARRLDAAWWRQTTLAAVTGATVLATWFAWTLLNFGVEGSFFSNTSVIDQAPNMRTQFAIIALNLRDTLVPHFLREVDYGFIAQSSPWGWWRDWFFQLYQVNLPFALGSTAWLGLIVVLLRSGRAAPPRVRAGWALAIAGTIIIGVSVHTGRDHWGLAHICLQPLILTGLVFVAARWNELGRRWRRVLIVGGALDFIAGIALHFGIESFLIDAWIAAGRTLPETLSSYTFTTSFNLKAKQHNQWEFFGDSYAVSELIILMGLGAVLLLALLRANQRKTAKGLVGP